MVIFLFFRFLNNIYSQFDSIDIILGITFSEFQELAIGILRECYLDDAERAMKLLIRPLNYWGKTNCVSIAIEASNKEFIAQGACQELFSAIWWGEMDTENGLKVY